MVWHLAWLPTPRTIVAREANEVEWMGGQTWWVPHVMCSKNGMMQSHTAAVTEGCNANIVIFLAVKKISFACHLQF
jgi:hypothetical protein